MSTLHDYQSFAGFFRENADRAVRSHARAHEEFVRVFDQVLALGRTHLPSEQVGTAIALLLRAAKYLYVAHELALQGHTEESRVLLRSVTELEMIGFLVFREEEVFELWKECFQARMDKTADGGVDVSGFREKKYEVAEIAKKYKETLRSLPSTNSLLRRRGEFSTYFSHENLYNVAVRLDQEMGETSIYVGTSAESANDRMKNSIRLTVDLLKEIESLMREVASTALA